VSEALDPHQIVYRIAHGAAARLVEEHQPDAELEGYGDGGGQDPLRGGPAAREGAVMSQGDAVGIALAIRALRRPGDISELPPCQDDVNRGLWGRACFVPRSRKS
jgi:hypothetical protein